MGASVLLPNPKDLVDIADKLGIIQAVKQRLFNQPDPASAKLGVVLDELSKIFGAFELELVRYLALTFDSIDDVKISRKALLELEGDAVRTRMNAARGHCKRIWNIYETFLNPWFQRVLKVEQVGEMRSLFLLMYETDGMMVNLVDDVAGWLAQEASGTLELVDSGKLDLANERVAAARHLLLPIRREVSGAMRKLLQVEADIIESSGAV